ncbi:uncharacterized protein THITE_2140658 [Thermothielavioides terrestris NRRL 8126]|uniref:HD/PDEase domain-containing protein n=1 Tax=Thermothielavioides terrestris (strain ATCC 38088 / NRRL 8126) TaxID=578455 RepID=G2QXP2_THETT|nr:uncharacterized protein THITE_2140658 [Thermothielavioides terrestris NRRL 8126]AEO62360.1 hypothetical protein THITE_2140658 [Thermothielavioides terrestris NRRL 8126]
MRAFQDDPLVQSVTAYVKDYMKHYDASHSWDHIERVVAMAHHIYTHSDPAFQATLDLRIIHLAALLHDVGDHKYLQPHESPTTAVANLLTSLSCPPALANTLQTICLGVSYTAETRDPARTAALVAAHPELAVVQDADRLDAIGAVGLARMFTFGGARTGRSMAGTMAHLDEKLVKLEGMMKTAVGREVARRRGERLAVFRGWWEEEVGRV